MSAWLVVALALTLGGCARQVGQMPAAAAAGVAEPLAPPSVVIETFAVDGARSRVVAQVYRAGRLASLGHNHVVEARMLGGLLLRSGDGSGYAALTIPVGALRVDDPQARAAAGAGFERQPDADAVKGTHANMLGPRVLDADRWPHVLVRARIDRLAAGAAPATVALTLRGVERRYEVPLTVTWRAGDPVVSGTLQLRQSDFGITPFSVLGGALQVADEVRVDFLVVGRNSGASM